jgi:PadR family transcriptional regulator, regulatory protein AphA
MSRTSSPFSLELILLGILEKQPMHGYDLYKTLAALDGFALLWKVKQSHLYALLDKLEAQELLSTTLIPGETHPSRREFHLTPLGLAAFEAWMSSPVAHPRDMRQEFFARLYFARRRSQKAALDLLHKQQAACQVWQRNVQAQLANPALGEHTRAILSYRDRQMQTTLDWLAEYEGNLA